MSRVRMKPMKLQQNNYAFIDSQNLNLAIRGQGWKLDFARFRQYLKDNFSVTKAFLFIGYVAGNESLYTFLQKASYIVIFKPTLEKLVGGVKQIKGNVDAELVLHTMIELPNFGKAIIVSGDGDFYCLIEYLEQQGKLLQILIPNPRKYSALLRRFRSYFIYINNLQAKLGRQKKKEKE